MHNYEHTYVEFYSVNTEIYSLTQKLYVDFSCDVYNHNSRNRKTIALLRVWLFSCMSVL